MESDDGALWLFAEAELDGRPIKVRARDPNDVKIDPTRTHIVVAVLGYAIEDNLQLPSGDDYEKIETLETAIFDTTEGDPELVFVETGSGVVRYFAYTSDVDRTIAAISETSAPFEVLDLDSAEDPEWEIYRERIARLIGT
jgi:hypothetical protein